MSAEKDRVSLALKAALRYRNVSQRELAERIGVHWQTVGRYYNGDTLPSAPVAARIEQELNLPRYYLTRPPETEDEAMEAIAFWTAEQRAGRPGASEA